MALAPEMELGRTVRVVIGLTGVVKDRDGSEHVVSFSSSDGVSYSLDYIDSLTSSAWNIAISPIPGTGGTVTATHVNGVSPRFRFYRVTQLP